MAGYAGLGRILDPATEAVCKRLFDQVGALERRLVGVTTGGLPGDTLTVSVGDRRLTHLLDPVDALDGVNLQTLRRRLPEILVSGDIEFDAGVSGSAKGIDWTKGKQQRVRLTANVTFTFAGGVPGGFYRLILQQDATGGRSTTWPANVKWENDVPPAHTTAPNKVIYATFTCTALGTGGYLAFMTELPITAP